MNTSSSELIDQALAKAKSGDKDGAKKILAKVVKQEPGNARAWFMLSRLLEDKEQIKYCLNQVQKIKTDNAQAKAQLQELQPKPTSKPRTPTKTKQKPGISKIIAIVSAGVLGCCTLAVGCYFGLSALGLLITPIPTTGMSQLPLSTELKTNPVEVLTETPTLTLSETHTPIPTDTQAPTETFTPIPTETASSEIPTMNLPNCIPVNTARQVGTVVRVIDGDTIDVRLEDGITYRVRYIGMDTPEGDRPFSNEATMANSDLVLQKEVILIKDVSDVDKYDRLLRYVIVGNVFVNLELVKLGFAQAATYPPDVACSKVFQDAVEDARLNERGLWLPLPILGLTSTPVPGGVNGGGDCSPAYPDVCIPPPPPDLDCKDISYRRFKVLPPDPHRFDGDSDGIGCES